MRKSTRCEDGQKVLLHMNLYCDFLSDESSLCTQSLDSWIFDFQVFKLFSVTVLLQVTTAASCVQEEIDYQHFV